ncbi:hypothetical protein Ciccas_014301, partial [Cichlidogyrus casuarinus]
MNKRYYQAKLKQDDNSDLTFLYLIEAFTEAAPQLTLQCYIYFTQPSTDEFWTQIP